MYRIGINRYKKKELCVELVIYKDYNEMYGQQNIKNDCNISRFGKNDLLLLLFWHISMGGQFIVAPNLTTCTLKIKYVTFVGNGIILLAINCITQPLSTCARDGHL